MVGPRQLLLKPPPTVSRPRDPRPVPHPWVYRPLQLKHEPSVAPVEPVVSGEVTAPQPLVPNPYSAVGELLADALLPATPALVLVGHA